MSNKQPQVMQSSNSLVIGLSVYQYLCRQSKPVPAKAIAIDTGLHIRKVQRILKVLADLNFINRSSADRNTYLYTAANTGQ